VAAVSISDISLLPPLDRSASIQRWRRRSRAIRVLRIVLPSLIGVILAGLAASVAYTSFKSQAAPTASSNDPIRLVNPRFVGRDDHGRPFLLIAASATRDLQDYQKVYLDKPALVLDDEGPDPLRITAAKGVYHEANAKLEVSGGVRLAGARGAFDTAQSLFDIKTGELIGSGPIHGAGPLGEIQAKSYGVYDKGARMVFKGGVHTRLQPK
jgi:lipopolysaccharide export system protein LptC